jgi:hypothetical protein
VPDWTAAYLEASARVFEPPIGAMQGDDFMNGYRGWLNNWHTVQNEAMFQLAVLRDDPAKVDYQVAVFKRLLAGRTKPASASAGYASDAYVLWDPAILLKPEDRDACVLLATN